MTDNLDNQAANAADETTNETLIDNVDQEPDTLTILRAPEGTRLTKKWCSDGTISDPETTKGFGLATLKVAHLWQLHKRIRELRPWRDRIVIRGQYVGYGYEATQGDIDGRWYRDRISLEKCLFEDAPLHWVCFTIDGFVPKTVEDVAANPVGAARAVREFIATLPPPFHNAHYFWLQSSSAGHPSEPRNELRAKLFFWMDRRVTCAQVKAYAQRKGLAVDLSALGPVEPLETAKPVFDNGVEDPVPFYTEFRFGKKHAVDASEIAPDTQITRPRMMGVCIRPANSRMSE
jgi:hypothetical protein